MPISLSTEMGMGKTESFVAATISLAAYIGHHFLMGTLPCFLSGIFSARVRYSSFAFCFNAANALFGGIAPLVATWSYERATLKLPLA